MFLYYFQENPDWKSYKAFKTGRSNTHDYFTQLKNTKSTQVVSGTVIHWESIPEKEGEETGRLQVIAPSSLHIIISSGSSLHHNLDVY